MKYRNSEIKVDSLIAYLNDNKINLNPAFQRGHVWSKKQRQGLIRNILLGKPIPAIFLYKEAAGARYSYNILDGKQRLESIILFVASKRNDFNLTNWSNYFFSPVVRKHAEFEVELAKKSYSIATLTEDLLRDFREYIIPTIEIELDEATSLDEVISLFIDINQQGEPVKRFDIVKALYKKKGFLKDVFTLIAQEQTRGSDVFYRMIRNDITKCLKQLLIISQVQDPNARVDRMWERLLEIALFAETNAHSKPMEILKDFIKKDSSLPPALSAKSNTRIRNVFKLLHEVFKGHEGAGKPFVFAREYSHFYVLTTLLLGDPSISKRPDLASKLATLSTAISKRSIGNSKLQKTFREYLDLSSRQTTDPSKRRSRVELFNRLVLEI